MREQIFPASEVDPSSQTPMFNLALAPTNGDRGRYLTYGVVASNIPSRAMSRGRANLTSQSAPSSLQAAGAQLRQPRSQ